MAVYPRWRGEHIRTIPKYPQNIGLSPLARGTLGTVIDKASAARFIPAGAGNTHMPPRSQSRPAVYPRWRGEHPDSAFSTFSFSGLSPLARGTRDDSIAADESERFIPAGAGNSAGNITNKINVNGLSPLARGTLLINRQILNHERFIPAGAGNSWG